MASLLLIQGMLLTPAILLSIASYALLAVLVAFMAFGRRMDYSSAFVLCFFMTPIFGIFAIMKSDKTIRISHYTTRYQCTVCNYEFTEEAAYCSLCGENGEEAKVVPIRKILA